MTNITDTPRLLKFVFLLVLAYCSYFVALSPKAFAALDGEASTIVPNNGINTSGGTSSTFSPWLVVTRPGTNGMDAPSSKTYVYLPVVNKSTDRVVVQLFDGCDNASIDSRPENNNSKFFISKVANVNITTTQVFSRAQPLTGIFELTCKDIGYATDTITIWPRTSGDPSGWTDTIIVDDVEYYKILIEARVVNSTGSLYYENRYRVSTSTAKSFVGFAESSGNGSNTLDYTGISYGFSSSSSWGWSTKIGFAPKCSDSITSKKINFYDTDHSNVSGVPASPFWQSNDYPMRWRLIEYNRRTRAYISETSGTLTGGGDVVDPSSPTSTFRPDRVYEIEISNINRVNSIQIQIPFDQIYTNDDCNSPPTGSITASCTDSGVVTVQYSLNDTQNETLTTTFTAPQLWTGNLVRSNAIGTDYSLGQFNFTGVADTNYTVQATINDGVLSTTISTTYKCPGLADCSFVSPSATFYEPNDSVTPKLKITRNNVSGAPPISVTASVSRNGSPVSATSTNPITITLPTTEAYVDFQSYTFNDSTDLTTGNFVYSGSISWGDGSKTASCGSVTTSVVKKPYFTVLNGDLVVGAVYPSGDPASCSSNPTSGNLYSWASVSSITDRKGANSEHVAKVFGTALDFYSASTITDNVPPTMFNKWLTIANTSGTWGGNAGPATCLTDYYETTKKSGMETINANTSKSVQELKDQASTYQQVEINGNLTLSGISGFTGKLAIYVTGNAYISSDITQKTSYASRSDIPFFVLIVKGNIYIAPGVTQLYGMYVAQPDGGSGGTIFTCGTASFSPVGQANIYDQCNNPLLFNGIVQARDIKLHRTRGTLKNGPEAEKFNNLPELYMAGTPFKSSASSDKSYDSAVSLPPLL